MAHPAGMSDDEDFFDEYYDEYEDIDRYQPAPVHTRTKLLKDQVVEAVNANNISILQDILTKNSLSPDFQEAAYSGLLCAGTLGYISACECLLENGADVNYSRDTYTPLMAVCSSSIHNKDNLTKCYELFVNSNVNVHVENRYKITPLMMACREGNIDIVKGLVKSGVNINQSDSNGWTALFYSAFKGRMAIVKFLIEMGADIHITDNNCRFAYNLAEEKNYFELTELLKPSYIQNIEVNDKLNLSELKNPSIQLRDGFQYTIYKMLQAMEMAHYFPQFQNHNVSLFKFLTISDEELKEIGVRFSYHRSIILNGIEQFIFEKWKTESLGLKQKGVYLSLIDGCNLIATITLQFCIIRATVRRFEMLYIKSLKKNEYQCVLESLNKYNIELIRNINKVYKFVEYTNKISENTKSYLIADLIEYPEKTKPFGSKLLIFGLLGCSLLSIRFIYNKFW